MQLRVSIFIIFSLSFYILISSSSVYTDEISQETRDRILIEKTEPTQGEKTVDDASILIESTVEYGVATKGEQIFEVVNSQGKRISRLEYPHRGEMLMLKGEIASTSSRFSIGGRLGSSLLEKKISKDQDWLPATSEQLIWRESEQPSKPGITFYDVNLYYNLLNLSEDEIEKERSSLEKNTLFDHLMVDILSLDIFVGYLYHKGRYPMTDGVYTILSYSSVNQPFSGLNSFYKVRYRGPKLGLRLKGSSGKANARVRVAYAWLKTNGYGWWNLRDYAFWQTGRNGYGIDIGFEVTYPFTPSLSGGIGYNYLYCRQNKLKESGVYYNDPASNYNDSDIIRNVDCQIYGLSFILRYIW